MFGCCVKARSMKDEEFSNMCFVFNYLSKSVMSSHRFYASYVFNIKATNNYGQILIFVKNKFKIQRKILTNFSSSSMFWLGNIFKQISLRNLPLIVISKLMHS